MTSPDGLDGPIRNGPLILLVEDSQTQRQAMCRLLLAAGYTATQGFATAREAVTLLEHLTADLVILDATLGREDAYPDGCAAALDIVGRWPRVRVAMLTGWSRDDPELAGCPEGMPVLQKPLEYRPLIHAIERLLRQPPWSPA